MMPGEDCLQLLGFVAKFLALSNCRIQLRSKILIVLHERVPAVGDQAFSGLITANPSNRATSQSAASAATN
jgi:hypothetical protein